MHPKEAREKPGRLPNIADADSKGPLFTGEACDTFRSESVSLTLNDLLNEYLSKPALGEQLFLNSIVKVEAEGIEVTVLTQKHNGRISKTPKKAAKVPAV